LPIDRIFPKWDSELWVVSGVPKCRSLVAALLGMTTIFLVFPRRCSVAWQVAAYGASAHAVFVCDFVVAGFAAGQAIVQAILAEADVKLCLAEAAVPFALAAVFGHFALGAAMLLGGGGHGQTLARRHGAEKFRW